MRQLENHYPSVQEMQTLRRMPLNEPFTAGQMYRLLREDMLAGRTDKIPCRSAMGTMMSRLKSKGLVYTTYDELLRDPRTGQKCLYYWLAPHTLHLFAFQDAYDEDPCPMPRMVNGKAVGR